jgi:hypothetical protein
MLPMPATALILSTNPSHNVARWCPPMIPLGRAAAPARVAPRGLEMCRPLARRHAMP